MRLRISSSVRDLFNTSCGINLNSPSTRVIGSPCVSSTGANMSSPCDVARTAGATLDLPNPKSVADHTSVYRLPCRMSRNRRNRSARNSNSHRSIGNSYNRHPSGQDRKNTARAEGIVGDCIRSSIFIFHDQWRIARSTDSNSRKVCRATDGSIRLYRSISSSYRASPIPIVPMR